MAMTRTRSLAVLTTAVMAAVPALVIAPVAGAAPADRAEKVRICHRTSAVTNPYVSIEVARSSVDGDAGNDRGQGDHYALHTGPVWSVGMPKGTGWGDIIPPIDGVHEGRNWTPLGQALWSAGCRPTAVSDTDGDLRPDVVDDDIDGDGVPNALDPDDDGDGIQDTRDPDDPGPSTDSDGDGLADWVDSDDDGDGVPDVSDCATVADSTGTAGDDGVQDDGVQDDGVQDDDGDAMADPDADGSDGGSVDTRIIDCREDGTPVPPRDDAGDSDGDGIPNATDPDDDGDGVPDTRDDDQDGDGLPDATDPDDDGDGVPDPLDEDEPPVEPSSVVDTDGDGTPDSRDRDDDGDGVPDDRDADADGDGRPEVNPQPLAPGVVLPARIDAGRTAVLWEGGLRTVSGAAAEATVRCRPAFRGDVIGTTRSLCDVRIDAERGQVRVRGSVTTIVTVVVTASAVGDYRPLRAVTAYRVTP